MRTTHSSSGLKPLLLSALLLAPPPLFAAGPPVIQATKTDQLAVDNNSNGNPDPGDTLRYTVVITNAGGDDALAVMFGDVLDPNTTFVAGSVRTTPLARNDSYAALGNVQITVAAPGVLANDSDPDAIGPALTVMLFTGTSANGGNVSISANGAFTYNPPPGFEGTDTFTYTLNDNDAPNQTDTGTVSIAVSGMIWFVNSAAGAPGDGRLTSPFNSLANFNALAADDPGDNLFFYSGSYAGTLTVLNNQRLLGQGATASLTTLTGLTPPAGSLALPATGGTRPTGNNVTLASGNLVRGLNLSATSGTALLGVSVGSLTASECSITNTGGTAIHLANGTLAASFNSVSASGGADGIKLVGTTGSFAVLGAGGAGSGGVLQNSTGADGTPDGCGVYLDNASNVSLSSMSILNHPNFAIRGLNVTGFTLTGCTVGGVNGNNAAFSEGSVAFSNLLGSATISGCSIAGGLTDNVRVQNGSGTLNRLTVQNSTIGANDAAFGNDGLFVEALNAAILNLTVSNCTFTSARGDLLNCNAQNSSSMNWLILKNAFSNNHPGVLSGGGGTTFAGGGGGSAVNVTYDISNNTFRDAHGIAVNVFKGTGGGSLSGVLSNNTVGVSGLANSGSSQASGIQVTSSGTGTHTARIENNRVYRYNENGIYVRANDGNSTINATLLGNTVAQPEAFAINGLQLNIGGLAGDANFVCADVRNNTLAGSGPFAADDFALRQRFNTTIKLPGYAGAVGDTTAVVNFVRGNNVASPDGFASVSGTGGGFVGGAACVLPLLVAPGGVPALPPGLVNPSVTSPRATAADAAPGSADAALAGETAVLDEAGLQAIVAAAKDRWQAAGLTPAQRATLDQVKFTLADIGGLNLGVSSAGHVQLDRHAAGHGWFIDPTPLDDAEFTRAASATRVYTAPPQSPAGRVDLLTTVLHELGHAAGLADVYDSRSRSSLMYGHLTVGERRLPAAGQAAGAVPGAVQRTSFLFTPVNVGTLPAGKAVTLTFLATINSPLPGVCQLTNQGTVSGGNFSPVPTDDPETIAAGDPTITVMSTLAPPTIAAVPANVCANSAGNQASGPLGVAAYAWTIANGTITSPVNLQTVTYSAGAAGNVTLGLTVFSASGCSASTATNVAIVVPTPPVVLADDCSLRTNYFASQTFTDALGATTTGIAFDGTNYWSCSGGGAGGVRLARYDAAGGLLATYSPGRDFRALFTDASGALFAREYNNPVIYRQTAPGTFAASVTLTGGSLNVQASVGLNAAGTEFVAHNAGLVSRWSTNGAYLGSVTLQGFGSVGSENTFPQNRALAVAGSFWLTYDTTRVLSVWDPTGNRVMQTTLSGAGTTFDSLFGFNYCNGRFFVVDAAAGTWRGYDICTSEKFAIYGAPGVVAWNSDVQAKVLGSGLIPQLDAYLVNVGNPVPTLADLRRYRAVLVYSDATLNSNTNLGNALADYVDAGGGVAMSTFVFSGSGGLGMQGRLVTGGYMPFTSASQGSGTPLTLVPDLPLHPLLAGVASLNGGSSSFHNSPISVVAGATLVAHWSNGQPLVGARDITAGRMVGLNFYPPSSDVRGDFWLAGTDGARLLANALQWAGKAAPTILTNPANQIGPIGSFVTFRVAAVGSEPLTYQWRRDGLILAGQTASALTLEVQPANEGNYSVVVSNAYGLAFSASAALGSQLKFLPPGAPAGGLLPLFIGSSDNCPLTPERAARIRVHATTNLGLPFASWTQLSNPLVLTNGLLRVDALNATAPAWRFFRAVETP